ECFNCHKKGHIRAECWAKGGGREGQGPKGQRNPNRTHQANDTSTSLNDVTYMANPSANNPDTSRYDWLLDSGTTSHICT
ncbi:hypothetical protein FA15DRAFT_561514, partial [Coprinopsis marcescibilis]